MSKPKWFPTTLATLVLRHGKSSLDDPCQELGFRYTRLDPFDFLYREVEEEVELNLTLPARLRVVWHRGGDRDWQTLVYKAPKRF